MVLALLVSLAHAEPPNLEGTWALKTHSQSQAKLPILGKIKASSDTLALAEVRRVDGVLQQSHKACVVSVEGGSLVSSRMPPAYSAHLPRRSYPLLLTAQGDGWSVTADWGQMTYGWSGKCAEMPAGPEDPCVADHDNDGHPGVTIQAKIPMFAWAEIYLAQTNHAALSGTVESADKMSGQLEIRTSTSSVLDASNRLFTRDPPVTTPVPAESYWTMMRLPEGATCDAVFKAFE